MPLRAADITVGATTWYSWWDLKPKDAPGNKFDFDPAFLYGPVIAVKINNEFSLNSVFLYGEYDGEFKYYSAGPASTKAKRYDSDTSISYRLNDYFKFFGGFKYVGYKVTIAEELPIPEFKVDTDFYGPAAGLSLVLPLIDNFYLLANFSGMYLWGKSDNSQAGNVDGGGWGYNTTGSIAYYIPAASMTLSLGGRYQYLEWRTDKSNMTESDHKFYGITASATYTFSI